MSSLVSIITPSYNSSRFIAQTIESVLSQSYQNWEMLIVDDMSPDNSNEIIQKYINQDKRIRLIKLEVNSGPAIARNRAIEESKGRYLAFLDADDLWESVKLERQIKFMNEKDCALSYSSYNMMNENGEQLGKIANPPQKVSYRDLLKSNYIGCLTAIYDTSKVGKVYMPIIKKRQDYALWLKILKDIDYAYKIDEVLASYRVLSNSVSSNKFSLLKYHYKLFREYEKLNIFQVLYYLTWNILTKYIYR